MLIQRFILCLRAVEDAVCAFIVTGRRNWYNGTRRAAPPGEGLLDNSASMSREAGGPHEARVLPVVPVQVVATLYALWLVALTVASHLSNSQIVLELILLAGTGPALAQSVLLPADTRGTAASLWFLWAFVIVFLVSDLINNASWTDLANVINVIFVFLIGFVVACCDDRFLIRRIAATYAVLLVPYLVYVNVFGNYIFGRLNAGAQPNLWGLIALNVAVGAYCVRNRLLAGACWATVLVTLYHAQARGSMVALVPLVAVGGYAWWRHSQRTDRSWKVLAALAVLLSGMAILVVEPDFFINNVMRLNDPNRGLQSGLTGRDVAWGEALRIWYGAPLLGVGFRRHELFMEITQFSSSHNAYIAMLADTGFVGFTVYVLFLAGSFVAALRLEGDPRLRLFLIAVIVSYSFAGMFERRAINAGNSFSITFIFACLLAMRLARAPGPASSASEVWHPAVNTAVQAVPDSEIPVIPAVVTVGRPQVTNVHEIRAVVESFLDVDAVARAGLGRFARTMTDRQWREYRRLLRDMFVFGYAAHFSAYSVDSLQVGRVVANEDGTAFVRTRMEHPASGSPIALDWRIGAGNLDGFKVLDVVIDDVSVARTLRADFAAIVANGGYSRLLKTLQRQVDDLKSAVAA